MVECSMTVENLIVVGMMIGGPQITELGAEY